MSQMTPYTKKSLIALGVLTLAFAFSQWRLTTPPSMNTEELKSFKEAMEIENLDPNDPARMKAALENKYTKGLSGESLNPNQVQKEKNLNQEMKMIKERQEKLFNEFTHSFKQSELQGNFKITAERGILSNFEFTFELPEPTDLTDEELIQGLNLVAVDSIEGKVFFTSSGQSISLEKEIEKDSALTKKGTAKALVRVGERRSILPCKTEFSFQRSTEKPGILTVKTSIMRNELDLPEGKTFHKTGSNLSELAFKFVDTQEVIISYESKK